MSDLPVLLDAVALQCSGDRPHEYCLSGDIKRAQVYTPELAASVIHGLKVALHEAGDERFGQASSPEDTRFSWACDAALTSDCLLSSCFPDLGGPPLAGHW